MYTVPLFTFLKRLSYKSCWAFHELFHDESDGFPRHIHTVTRKSHKKTQVIFPVVLETTSRIMGGNLLDKDEFDVTSFIIFGSACTYLSYSGSRGLQGKYISTVISYVYQFVSVPHNLSSLTRTNLGILGGKTKRPRKPDLHTTNSIREVSTPLGSH